MKRLLILLLLPMLASAQWRLRDGKLTPTDPTRTVDVQTLEGDTVRTDNLVSDTMAVYHFRQVPSDALGLVTSNFGSSLNDTVTICALYLPHQMKLGAASVATGTASGSAAVRGYTFAVYDNQRRLKDTTLFTAFPGNGTASRAGFRANATVGPGLVYVAFSTYNDGTYVQQFRAPDLSTNSSANTWFAVQNASYPIIGYGSRKITQGGNWPSTITIVKSTTTTLYPYIVLFGTQVD
jgi:hypothetical protein